MTTPIHYSPNEKASYVLGKVFEEVAYNPAMADAFPFPWWAQCSFRLYEKIYGPNWRTDPNFYLREDWKQKWFSCNDFYHYWSIVGVGNFEAEALVGQGGEVETYADGLGVTWHLYDPESGKNLFPCHGTTMYHPRPGTHNAVRQQLVERCIPIVETRYETWGIEVKQTVAGLWVGPQSRSIASIRYSAKVARPIWLVASVVPFGPHGWCAYPWLKYHAAERVLETPRGYGILLDEEPDHYGVYGNGDSSRLNPQHYLNHYAYSDLKNKGRLNGADWAEDRGAELCMASFAWELQPHPTTGKKITVRVPLEEGVARREAATLLRVNVDTAYADTVAYWKDRLFKQGAQPTYPSGAPARLADTFRVSRAYLRLLSDEDKLHPGPSVIYNKFWVRDSAVEAVAASMAGDGDLSHQQFLRTYRKPGYIFQQGPGNVGQAQIPRDGYYGGDTERDNREWDGNGLALWAIGRHARMLPPQEQRDFCVDIYFPYVLKAARWYLSALTQHDILPAGWSAEHLGDRSQAHYWDDLCGVAGLYEAARLAERCDCYEKGELWSIFDKLKWGTRKSIEWVLDQQRATGQWQTFVPSGPYDWGRADSSMVGSLFYFQAGRLHIREKLGPTVDYAMRQTLETIWSNFVDNGFYSGSYGFQHRDNDSWRSYGAYLTIQAAHSFLCTGQIDKMEKMLRWSVDEAWLRTTCHFDNATHGKVSAQASHGALNEQHLYSLATGFNRVAPAAPYIGDIPHGWSSSEFIMILRSILFMEVDEDNDPTILLAPGIPASWFSTTSTDRLGISNAPCSYGAPFAFTLEHDPTRREIAIRIDERPWTARFVYQSPFSSPIQSLRINGQVSNDINGATALLPPDTREAIINY